LLWQVPKLPKVDVRKKSMLQLPRLLTAIDC
jgi:hypothetical protein